MKAIFTFIIFFVLSFGSFSQTPASSNSKVFFSLAIETQSFSLSKVYPNPVKDFVTVELQVAAAGDVKVNLYNILGVEVKAWEPIFLSQGDQQIRLDLSMIKSGVYILKITQSGKVCSQVLKKS